jgi:hypothetical protein
LSVDEIRDIVIRSIVGRSIVGRSIEVVPIFGIKCLILYAHTYMYVATCVCIYVHIHFNNNEVGPSYKVLYPGMKPAFYAYLL